ncbi:trigger factor, partial [bacterium]|nr:trigger factor [bacterium]
GFRPGKAPKELVQKLYNGTIHEDVMNHLVTEAYRTAIKDHDLRVVGEPRFEFGDVDAAKDLSFSAEVEVAPEPKINDYFGIKFDAELLPEEITDSDLDQALEQVRQSFAAFEQAPADTVAELGHIATVTYQGELNDGTPEDGRHVTEIGKNILHADVEKALIGMKAGEQKQVTATFPEDDQVASRAGKTINCTVTLERLDLKKLSPIDDELAKRARLGETVSEMKEQLEQRQTQHVKSTNDRTLREKLFDAIVAKNPFVVPEAMVLEEIREMLFEMGALDRRKRESYSMDLSSVKDSFLAPATARVQRFIALEQIIKQENYSVDAEAVETWVANEAVEHNMTVEAVKKSLGLPERLPVVKNMVARHKMVEMLLEQAQVNKTFVKPEAEKSTKKTKSKK